MADRYYPIDEVKLAYPSVTTILNIVSKGFGYEKWLRTLAKEESEKITSVAADLGTRAHAWIENHITSKQTLMLDDDIKPAVNAFLQWESEHKVKYVKSECMVYSKCYEYAGRFDVLAEVDGYLTLVDFKTSKAFYDTMGLQLSAYAHAYYELFYAQEGASIEKLLILRLDKVTGMPYPKEYKDEFNMFKHALELWKWRNKYTEVKSKKKYEEMR